MIMYAVVAFFVFFFIWKRRGEELTGLDTYEIFLFELAFWDIALTTLFWPLAIPAKIAWSLMNKAYDKFDKPKTKQQ